MTVREEKIRKTGAWLLTAFLYLLPFYLVYKSIGYSDIDLAVGNLLFFYTVEFGPLLDMGHAFATQKSIIDSPDTISTYAFSTLFLGGALWFVHEELSQPLFGLYALLNLLAIIALQSDKN